MQPPQNQPSTKHRPSNQSGCWGSTMSYTNSSCADSDHQHHLTHTLVPKQQHSIAVAIQSAARIWHPPEQKLTSRRTAAEGHF